MSLRSVGVKDGKRRVSSSSSRGIERTSRSVWRLAERVKDGSRDRRKRMVHHWSARTTFLVRIGGKAVGARPAPRRSPPLSLRAPGRSVSIAAGHPSKPRLRGEPANSEKILLKR
jgi:hypothetical protein